MINENLLKNKQDIVPALGSATKPIYTSSNGIFSGCSTYAGATKTTLNGTDKGASTISIYAPTSAGTSGYILKSNGSNSAPTYVNHTTLASNSYSTTETRVGTWIDSKPIYRKVLSFTTPSSAGDFTIGTISNLSKLVSLRGIVNNQLPIPNDWANLFSVSLRVVSGTIKGRVDWDDYLSKSGYAIVEYTKTTD